MTPLLAAARNPNLYSAKAVLFDGGIPMEFAQQSCALAWVENEGQIK
jgi:hypothetical protein